MAIVKNIISDLNKCQVTRKPYTTRVLGSKMLWERKEIKNKYFTPVHIVTTRAAGHCQMGDVFSLMLLASVSPTFAHLLLLWFSLLLL